MLYCTELLSHNGLDGIGAGVGNHGEAVYIIKAEALYIINSVGIVSHQAAKYNKGGFSAFIGDIPTCVG